MPSARAAEQVPAADSTALDPYLVMNGFYDRKRTQPGHFLDPAAVAKVMPKAKFVADLMTHVPGVRFLVPEGSGGIRVPLLRSCRTRSRMASNLVAEAVYPRLYLDGNWVQRDVFGWLLPAHVLAIEVYMGPAQIPLQYGGTGEPCGLIHIWTKH